MLHVQINPHSGVPVYRQMIDQVKYYEAPVKVSVVSRTTIKASG